MLRPDESDGQGVDRPADEAPVPAATAASWRAAEGQLFAAVLGAPEVYQRALVLVGTTASRLRLLGPSTQALLGAAAEIAALVREVAAAGGLAPDALDPDLVGRAALALRHREVVGEQAAARRLRVLRDAAARGAAWVVLEESGDWDGDPLAPYRRLEAHVASGRALLVTARPDEDLRGSRHAVEVVQVDLATARIEASPAATDAPVECLSAADREAYVTAYRAAVGRPGGPLAPTADMSDSKRQSADPPAETKGNLR
jgi:hypothetical protein